MPTHYQIIDTRATSINKYIHFQSDLENIKSMPEETQKTKDAKHRKLIMNDLNTNHSRDIQQSGMETDKLKCEVSVVIHFVQILS